MTNDNLGLGVLSVFAEVVPHFPTFECFTSLAALVATLEISVSFKPRTSRIRLPTAVLASRVIFKVGVILSVERTAYCGGIVYPRWSSPTGPSTPRFFDFSTVQCSSCGRLSAPPALRV